MGDLEKEDNMDRGQILLCTTLKGESVLVISTFGILTTQS